MCCYPYDTISFTIKLTKHIMFYAQPYTLEEINTILDEAENDFENGSFIPNEETIAAIQEAKSDKNHSKVYSNAEEMIYDILSEEK